MADDLAPSTWRVACVVPTFNGRAELERLLASLEGQTLAHDLIVVDSSSTDGTAEIGHHAADVFIGIDQRSFNHGATRQMAIDRLPDHDLIIFMTQDAELAASDSLARLVAPFVDPDVAAVCGRQLPHHDANSLAAHARLFNYPPETRVASAAKLSEMGIRAAFISNSFAAYRRAALMEVGGFPDDVILAEDMHLAARLLLSEHKIVYAGDAICRHSHNYGLREEGRRYFDTGVFHARAPWIRGHLGGAGGQGARYVLSELRYVGTGRPWRWPASLLRNAVKLAAFQIGLRERFLPVRLKRRLSLHRRFWDSDRP